MVIFPTIPRFVGCTRNPHAVTVSGDSHSYIVDFAPYIAFSGDADAAASARFLSHVKGLAWFECWNTYEASWSRKEYGDEMYGELHVDGWKEWNMHAADIEREERKKPTSSVFRASI